MKLNNLLKKTLFLTFLILLCVNQVYAEDNGSALKILWEKDLVLDTNTNSVLIASCLNKDGDGIIVMTRESPKGTVPIQTGDCVIWDVSADGNTIRTLPKDGNESKIQTGAEPIGPGCAIASDSFGNLLTVGILSKQKDEKRQKVAIVSKADKAEKIMSHRNSIETHSAIKMIPSRDNTFVLVGDRNSDGLCMRIDNQGNVLEEKLFDTGQIDIFSDVDQTKSDSSNLAIVGLSFKNEGAAGMSGKNFILLYDPNFKTIHEDLFMGWKSVPMLSLVMLRPKVCCLDNGNIVVLYSKENTDPNDLKTQLWTKCYTRELELLWEKEVFTADKTPFTFDIVSSGPGGFVVGIVLQLDGLELYSFDRNGIKKDYVQYKNMVGPAGFNLMNVKNKTIAVFEWGTEGNIKKCSMKARVIALD